MEQARIDEFKKELESQLEQLLQEAGMPDGVINFVPGSDRSGVSGVGSQF